MPHICSSPWGAHHPLLQCQVLRGSMLFMRCWENRGLESIQRAREREMRGVHSP